MTSGRLLCLAVVFGWAVWYGTCGAGEKWRDTTGISINTVNRNADAIRRAQSRESSFITTIRQRSDYCPPY